MTGSPDPISIDVFQKLEELQQELQKREELLSMIAVEYGLRLGEKTKRSEYYRVISKYRTQKRKIIEQIEILREKAINGEISREEYHKKKAALEEALYQVEKAKENDEKVKQKREEWRTIRSYAKMLFEVNRKALEALGHKVSEITSINDIPEWIRRIIEAEAKLAEAQKAQQESQQSK